MFHSKNRGFYHRGGITFRFNNIESANNDESTSSFFFLPKQMMGEKQNPKKSKIPYMLCVPKLEQPFARTEQTRKQDKMLSLLPVKAVYIYHSAPKYRDHLHTDIQHKRSLTNGLSGTRCMAEGATPAGGDFLTIASSSGCFVGSGIIVP